MWAPSLSCSLSPKSLWGTALIAGFLFVPEFSIPYPLLHQHHHITKTWLILNWAKLNMELSWTLNNPQTHQPQAAREDVSLKNHRVHSILFKTSLEPKVCDTWQITAPGSHAARRKSTIFTWAWLLFCNIHSKNGLHTKTGITPMKHCQCKGDDNSSHLLSCFCKTCNILALALILG